MTRSGAARGPAPARSARRGSVASAVLVWVALAPVGAAAQQAGATDARGRLRALLPAAPPTAPAATAALPFTSFADLLAIPRGVTDRPVLLRGGEGLAARVRAAGGRVTADAAGFVSAMVPEAGFASLRADPAVQYVEPAVPLATTDRPRRAASPFHSPRSAMPAAVVDLHRRIPFAGAGHSLLDVSRDDIRVGPLRQRLGERFEAVAGQGVIVGIVDSGLDLDHPDFLRPDGTTRVLYAWDQTDGGGPAPGRLGTGTFLGGSECDAATIDAGACRMQDPRGHGTHVLGIAAGDGSATGNGLEPYRYVGAAPEADLIAVKAGEFLFQSTDVVAGVAYIFERARLLGRPAAVVLALGTQAGPHDGTTAFETALDSLVGPGRVVVVTAGNAGAYENETPDFPAGPIHFQGDPAPGEGVDHSLVLPPYTPAAGAQNDAILLEVWHDGVTDLAVTVTPPGGAPLTTQPGDTALFPTSAGWVVVDNASAGTDPSNGDKQILIGLVDGAEGEEPAEGEWAIRFDTPGGAVSTPVPYHGWIVGSTFQGALAAPRIGVGASNSHVVSAPGTGDRMIAVGAHATRHTWPGVDGLESFPFREPLGDIAFFSGPGPRRDGVVRPDVTAPGKMVVSAYRPGGTDFLALPGLVEADGAHAALLGTSMATPQVAGVVALLLQRNATLTPEGVRSALHAGARSDAFVEARGGAPSGPWGFGKLDALASVRSLGSSAGRLAVAVAPGVPATPVVEGRQGEVLPLFALELVATTVEPILLTELAVRVTGADPGAELLLVRDEDRDGRIGAGEQRLAEAEVLAGVGDLGGALTVPAGASLATVVGLRLAGGAPNGATIRAVVPAGGFGTEGVLSGAIDALDAPASDVASPDFRVDLLAARGDVALSANPVRGDRLIVSFAEAPRRAAVFTPTGRLVQELATGSPGPGSVEWDLRDADGAPVANGPYFLMLDLPGGMVRQTVYVLRP